MHVRWHLPLSFLVERLDLRLPSSLRSLKPERPAWALLELVQHDVAQLRLLVREM